MQELATLCALDYSCTCTFTISQKNELTLFLGRGFVVTLMYSHTSCSPGDTAKLIYVLNHQYPGRNF